MEAYHAALDALRVISLLAGSLVIFLGIVRSIPEAIGAGGRTRVARRIGEHASLGLEFFVAATIINLALDPRWVAVAVTAFTVAIRQLLTLSLKRSLS
ncbi:MAG: DUF1622 domain-containing protein [Actinomycetota bacterium]|nr:DUF1622 domain-containing protein [Actinomycetota bacterium]